MRRLWSRRLPPRQGAEDAALLAQSSAKEAAASATKAAEDKIAATRERAAAIPEESELNTHRVAKKAAVLGMAFGGAITLGLLVIVYRKQPMRLVLKENIWTEIGATLGALLIVALIVERIVEILVSIWSTSKSDALLQQRNYYEKLQAKREKQISDLRKESCDTPPPNDSRQAEIVDALTTKRHEAADAERHADIAEKLLVPYGARTRRLAAWSGLAIGVLAASVGIRLMASLVIIDPLKTPESVVQYSAFLMVDVLLTGAVLAGGSIFIHQIFAVYENFMDSTKRRARGLDQAKADE